jgi:hypothetical protein
MVDWDKFRAILNDLKSVEGDDFCFHELVAKHHDDFFDNNNTLYWFPLLWKGIPERHLYETYKDLLSYAYKGYYNDFFKPELLERIMRLNKHDTVNNPELINLLDADGYLTVYHGHCKSTLRNANSWTIDKEIASFFGNRNALFNECDKYYVVTGRVRLDDVIAYVTSRNEAEIVVLNKNVLDKKKSYHDRDN